MALLQAGDLNKAVGWIVWAEKYDLPQFALRAKRYVVDSGANVSTCPAAKQLSRECLLWLLDARHVEKQDVERILFYGSEAPPGMSFYVWYRKKRGLSPL